MRTPICLLVLTSLLSAADDPGVIVYAKAEQFVFKLLRDATWDKKSMRYMPKKYGSAVGLRKDGYLISTAHQVKDAKTLHLLCPDGAVRKVDQWWWHNELDFAVIFVPNYEVPVSKFAPDNSLRIGEPVYAVGAPASFNRSITRGIVSGLHRLLAVNDTPVNPLQDYIQVDAQINDGNSGGPLLNGRGEVTGLICASLSISKRPRPGMCFAIPIDVIRVMGARFIEEREGVRGGQIKSDMANCNGLPLALREELSYTARDGVVLFDLEKKAKAAGLRERDIVTAVDGVKIANWMHLRVRLALQAPGKTVKFTIARKGKTLEVPFVLEPRS